MNKPRVMQEGFSSKYSLRSGNSYIREAFLFAG
ncbi:hypothetical protein C8N40_11252 [Pontibacter mucosus]|uniref:Uncharacterized protein n=1 Tax=Pontibacter mucosus TaxID=1649266 RepID=A0A2T5YCJ6_9BACT|nr:hypothetical protein C8N40_11252 [Pontibacter mucosus]